MTKPTTLHAPRSLPAAALTLLVGSLALGGCNNLSGAGTAATSPSSQEAPSNKRPVTLASVDLARYVGDWYVIGAIPTSFEEKAYNSKESYRLDADGHMLTTFTFNEGGYTGPLRTYNSTGYVLDRTTNAVWGQQYLWPIKADYRISHLSPDYRQVVVTREKRDYVWIMARTPTISDADYERLSAIVAREGYDVSKLRKIPQASGK